MNTTTDDRDDDDINNNADTSLEDVVKQPKVVVMKRTPSQFTDDGSSSHFVSTTSGGAEDSEEEEEDYDEGESSLAFEKEEEALAALSALTGENVYDSPTPPRNRVVVNDFPKTNGGDNHNNDVSLPPLEKQHHHHHQQQQDEDDELSGSGILSSGWAWLQRSRESSRRKYLQKEAEKQLQKIRDAEMSRIQQQHNVNKNGSSSSPSSSPKLKNPTFLQMRNFDGTTTTSTPKIRRTLSEDSSHVTTTESGEGASAHLDFGSLQVSENISDQSLVPQVRVAEESSGGNVSPYILTPVQMHQIAMHVLPSSVAYCKWNRIYGLGRDGDSFDGCLRKIDSVSRTLMVVRTTRNEIFGGYADSPWNSHAIHRSQFYGGAGACLFKIQNNNNSKNDTQPKQTTDASSSNNNDNNSNVGVNVYHWTGKNRYIQLCDVSRKMLAFGGGGDDGVFGLAVEEDFQKGSTGPCDTFDNEQLCSEEVFEIVDLEFWEFLTGMF